MSISTECVLHSRHVDVFSSNGEAYENAWDLPPAAETVVAVPQAVEEGRCAALLEWLTINVACSVK